MTTFAKGFYRLRFPNDAERLDLAISAVIPDISRTMARKVISIGGVMVNQQRIFSQSRPVKTGEMLELSLDGYPLDPWQMDEGHILFHDNWILGINKPAGVETQPTPARYKGTLYDAVQTFVGVPKGRQKAGIGMVQRLDRDTSGVIVFSIHAKAHKRMTELFSGRGVRKIYHALVAGVPQDESGEIRNQLLRGRKSNRMQVVASGGQEAVSRYRVLERFTNASLVEVELLTGRMHQVRVHMAHLGVPILGDRGYGGPSSFCSSVVPRQMLHASRLCFDHPVSDAPLLLEAPYPEDFFTLLNQLRTGGAV